jgi:hypothetical protein
VTREESVLLPLEEEGNHFSTHKSFSVTVSAIYFIKFNSSLFNEFVCNLGFFWHEWASLKLE